MKIALVFQGGGARGVFTSGVLDELLKLNIKIDKIYAVSAGSLNAVNFLSKQAGRSKESTILAAKSHDFLSIKNIIRKQSLLDFDFYFKKINLLLPFDNLTYETNSTKFCVVATSLKTGKATYFNKDVDDNFNLCIQASSSLPLISKIVPIYDDLYLDGGDSDPLPFKKAIEDGYDKIIVVTTRPIKYRKETNKNTRMIRLYKLAYYQYPEYIKALINSNENYNKQFDELALKNEKIFIISPKENIRLKHLESDENKLNYYYELGTKTIKKLEKKLVKFIN